MRLLYSDWSCCVAVLLSFQYYGEVLSKKPVELHRFYTDESTFCHASGTREEVRLLPYFLF